LLTREADDEILPVLWKDNYIDLLPGETREVTAIFRASEKNPQPRLEVEGWNVRPQAVSKK